MPEILHSFDFSENFADNQRGKYGLIDHVFSGLQQAVDKQGFSLDRYAGQLDLLLDSNLEGLEENESNSQALEHTGDSQLFNQRVQPENQT